MARRAFYNSREWQQCRNGYIKSVCGLCEKCKRPGYIVHHKIELTDANEDDPEVILSWGNLEFLCLACHNAEHFAQEITRKNTMFDDKGQLIEV